MAPKQKARSRSAPARAGTSAAPALRVTPPLGPLCEDTREHLWSCLSADLRAVRAAACLNKEWRVAAVEHGAPLQLSSPRTRHATPVTLKSLAAAFPNVMRLNARDSSLNDEGLRALGSGLLPSLTSVDVSGCQSMSSVGVKALVKGLGARLKEFSQDATALHGLCKEMRVTLGTIKAIAAAPALESLSLTLGSSVKSGLNNLNGHPSLRKLSLYFEGFEPPAPPSTLPALEELTIRVGGWTRFHWPNTRHTNTGFIVPASLMLFWLSLDYPKLKLLVVRDQAGDNQASVEPLNESAARDLANHLKARVEVRAAARRSDIRVPFVVDPE